MHDLPERDVDSDLHAVVAAERAAFIGFLIEHTTTKENDAIIAEFDRRVATMLEAQAHGFLTEITAQVETLTRTLQLIDRIGR